jgi:hypothetical protein
MTNEMIEQAVRNAVYEVVESAFKNSVLRPEPRVKSEMDMMLFGRYWVNAKFNLLDDSTVRVTIVNRENDREHGGLFITARTRPSDYPRLFEVKYRLGDDREPIPVAEVIAENLGFKTIKPRSHWPAI